MDPFCWILRFYQEDWHHVNWAYYFHPCFKNVFSPFPILTKGCISPKMKGLILKPMISLLFLGGSRGRCISFPPCRHLSSSQPCGWLTPAPHQWRQSSQRQTGGDWFRYWSTLTHIKPFTSLWAWWPSQCLIFTCGNKLEYKKSASMTTWAMISSDTPHRAEGSSGPVGEIAHGGRWSCTARWTTWGTEDSGTSAQTHQPSSVHGVAAEPRCSEGQGRKEAWP